MNTKHLRFVTEYLKDRNATQAARRAGYSKKTARQQGQRLLTNAAVRAEVDKREARLLEKNELTADRVLEEMRRVAFVNLQDFFHETGALKGMHELTREQAACVAALEVVIKNVAAGDGQTDLVHKLKLWDKLKSLEMLGKHFKLLDRAGESDLSVWEKLADRLASVRNEQKPAAAAPEPDTPA